MLALKYVGAVLAYALYTGLGTLLSLHSKRSSR